MANLCISLFGRLQISWNGKVLTYLESRKVQELFSYLLIYRERPHPRELLSSLLWGDSLTAQSKKNLRQTLWQLQVELNALPKTLGKDLLIIEHDWIQLNPDITLWIDVSILEQAFKLVRDIAGRDLDNQSAQRLHKALQVYQGDLLEGWYQDWCIFERERLQSMYLALLNKLMGHCEAHKKHDMGIAYGTRILRYDHAHERTHRRLMRLQYLAGDRTAALRQYKRCVGALDEELGVTPAKQTVALYDQIRQDQFISGSIEVAQPKIPKSTTAPLVELSDRLKQVRTDLADIHHQVQHNIQDVERTSKH